MTLTEGKQGGLLDRGHWTPGMRLAAQAVGFVLRQQAPESLAGASWCGTPSLRPSRSLPDAPTPIMHHTYPGSQTSLFKEPASTLGPERRCSQICFPEGGPHVWGLLFTWKRRVKLEYKSHGQSWGLQVSLFSKVCKQLRACQAVCCSTRMKEAVRQSLPVGR